MDTVKIAIWLACVTSALAVKSEILQPLKTGSADAALIIVPGAEIKGGAYRPLAKHIQETSGLRLWVALLEDFPLNTPNPIQLNGAIADAVSGIKKAGLKSNNIFIAGHSLGGVFVGNYGKSNAKSIKGILLFASYLTKGTKLATYPVPVLTISGDLDGLTRATRIADTFQELKADVSNRTGAKYVSPVVIMKGINHGQFASGTMPSNVLDYDLTPEVDTSTAQLTISQHVDNFMVATIGNIVPQFSTALQNLDQAYEDTDNFFKPLLAMKSNDVNAKGYSNWTVSAQYMISGLPVNSVLKVTNTELSELAFVESKPEVKTDSKYENIVTHTHLTYPTNLLDVSTVKNTPDSIDAKLKNKEAVYKALPKGFNPPTTRNITCRDINQAAWNFALGQSSQLAVQRFQSRKARPMKFIADHVYSTGIQWVMSSASWKETTKDVTFQSTSLYSKVDIFPASFAGMHYCKLLSPYRAMEWIYVDSLRSKPHNSFNIFG